MKSQNFQKLFWFLFSVLTLFTATLSLNGAAPAHGKQRLRELVIFPTMDLNFNLAWNHDGILWRAGSTADVKDEISSLQSEVASHPQDIQGWLQLGFLYSVNQQTNESRTSFEKAESVCREKLASRPKDGLLLTQLAKAVDELDKEKEAVSLYQQATQVSSNEWRTWMALGISLERRAYVALLPENLREMMMPFNPPPEKALDYQPSDAALKEANSLTQEAVRCVERAMALATNESAAFMQQAAFAQSATMTDFWLHYFQHGKFLDMAAWRGTFPGEKAVENIRKAADLKPRDCQLTGAAVYMDFMCWFAQNRSRVFDPQQLPEALERKIHQGMTRLETLSSDSDNKTACKALLNVAMLKLLMKTPPGDIAGLAEKATRLDPTQDQAWDLWIVCTLADEEHKDRLTAICESRLKQKNSAYGHLVFAKALVNESKWTQADAQTQEALKLEPDNIIALLMKIALIIRQSTDDASLEQCQGLFESYKKYLASTPGSQQKDTRWREGSLNCAIALGLYAAEDHRPSALKLVGEVLKRIPDDEDAKTIREALD